MGILAWFFYLQPRFLQLFLGRAIGFLFRVKGVRRQVIEQNLEIAYPSENPRFREKILKQAYDHLGNLVIELLFLFGPLPHFVRRFCTLKGREHWVNARAQGKGVIFISSHVGNWEVMAASGALLGDIDIMIVTKKLKPEWIHRAVERGRQRAHVLATYEPKTLKDVLRHLSRNGTVGFVMDQYSGPPVGVRVPVFGVPVGTPAVIATLARRTGAVVLSVVSYRLGSGRFITEIRGPLEWKVCRDDARLEIAENTALYAQELEKDIIAHSGQWLWVHRRFKGELGPLRPNEWLEGRSR
jgi:KDO2-lipid IV(A) lauroyltransferase